VKHSNSSSLLWCGHQATRIHNNYANFAAQRGHAEEALQHYALATAGPARVRAEALINGRCSVRNSSKAVMR
jgi:Tfp pilus assembly protein PilF